MSTPTLPEPALDQGLAEVLVAEIAQARRMLEVLALERAAIARRDLPAIEQAAAEKERLVAVLEGLAARQDRLLAAAGVDPRHPDPEAALTRAGLASVLAPWRELRAILLDCRQQNRINGGAIETLRRFARDVLAVLRGTPPGSLTYARTGEAQHPDAGEPLATA
jgi:flagellar biosynthesis/type III secretory pathway chaperone